MRAVIINGKRYNPVGYEAYQKSPELLGALSRAAYEGYAVPDENKQVALDQFIKGMKSIGIWHTQDVLYNFAIYNDTSLADFSLINLKNPWSRTNLVTYSSDFSNVVWTYPGNTKEPNTLDTSAPDGSYTAGKFINTGTPATSSHFNIIGNSTSLTYSIYTKAGTALNATFRLRDETSSTIKCSGTFEYSTEILTVTTGTGSVTNVGNGWYRITLTAINCVVGNSHRIYVGDTGSMDNGDNWYVWGAQVEDRPVASKYQPTGVSPIYGNGIATVHGGMTYTINGWEGNGVDGYIDTKFNPSLAANYQLNDAAIACVIYKIAATGDTISGQINTVDGQNKFMSNPLSSHRLNSDTDATFAFAGNNSTGIRVLVRQDSNNVAYYNKNHSQIIASASTSRNNSNITLMRRDTIYSDTGLSMYSAGAQISASAKADIQDLYNDYLVKIGLTAIA